MARVISTLIRLQAALGSRGRTILYRTLGCRIEGRVWLRRISIPRNWSCISLGDGAALDDGVVLLVSGTASGVKIRVGPQTYMNRYAMVDASESVTIGEGSMIGPFCYVTDHDHDRADIQGALISRATEIGRNCWLGAHVNVLKGVTIGDGATVGAGSVVTRDVPPGATVAGVPAKPI